MSLHPGPLYQPIPVKVVIPRSLGTRSQRISPWIPADEPAATIRKTEAQLRAKGRRDKTDLAEEVCRPLIRNFLSRPLRIASSPRTRLRGSMLLNAAALLFG
jgi:hypothetical protein